MDEELLYGDGGNALYVRARGHIGVKLCAELKSRVFSRLEAQPPVGRLFVDLSSCSYMDSTFLGLLVGFNKRLLRFAEKPITILGANETCQKLLRTIGLARLVEMAEGPADFPKAMESLSAAKASAELLLGAHRELSGLSPENEKAFAGLLSVLEKQAEEGSPEK